ncbi:MAG: hypothetical protein BM563_07910 [Bacteroidetes bacterium MedPE-SWsnd-G1]|nr:MAG: hypothetical protein BM563_07910 [Bacteroidetes bacterium MedPE-SWsnd-G1]
MRRFLLKLFKVVSAIIIVLLTVFLILIHNFFQPKSSEEILSDFKESSKEVYISNKDIDGKTIRVLASQFEIDTLKPTVVFVHGSPGSGMDFKKYLQDSELSKKANLITYDRVGYNFGSNDELLPIRSEVQILEQLISELSASKTIIVGYSYGGPIALGVKSEYKEVILCAPAAIAEVEPMFWFLNFYKWRATRWLVPEMLQTASKEKLSHANDLRSMEQNWGANPSNIKTIHGDKDWIVPYENALKLQQIFPKDQFELKTLDGASHDLIWSRYEEVKEELLKSIEA